MIINGEKWACEACVRGHRVSNCQHSERPLLHINKKGRPVSQCPHCRAVRKSRSAHVRCECGAKPHSGSSKSRCVQAEKAGSNRDGEGRKGCCCSHGSKCTCALVKDAQIDPALNLESDSAITAPTTATAAATTTTSINAKPCRRPPQKPRLSTTQADGPLTVFTNGHHKPAVKHNQMAHRCGAPYHIPRLHAVHDPPDRMRRSMDGHLITPISLDAGSAAMSPVHDATVASVAVALGVKPDARLVHSEQSPPHLSVSPDMDRHGRSALPPLDLTFSNFSLSAVRPSSASSSYDLNAAWSPTGLDPYFCPTPDSDQPIFSAGLEPPSVDWSGFDLPGASSGLAPSSHRQRLSYSSFDFNGGVSPFPQLATAADADDFGGLGVPSPLHPPSLVFNHFSSDNSDACESDSYRLSASSSMHGIPQLSLLASGNLDSIGMEDFLATPSTPLSTSDGISDAGSVSFVTASFPAHPALPEPTKLGPTSAPAHEKRYSLPVAVEALHPLWGSPLLEGTPIRHNSIPTPAKLGPEDCGADATWGG